MEKVLTFLTILFCLTNVAEAQSDWEAHDEYLYKFWELQYLGTTQEHDLSAPKYNVGPLPDKILVSIFSVGDKNLILGFDFHGANVNHLSMGFYDDKSQSFLSYDLENIGNGFVLDGKYDKYAVYKVLSQPENDFYFVTDGSHLYRMKNFSYSLD